MAASIKWAVIALLVLVALNAADGSLQPEQPSLQDPGNATIIVNADDILTSIEAGRQVNLSGVTIAGDLDMSRLNGDVKTPLRIINSTFLRAANFGDVTFDGTVDLRDNSFMDDLNFNGVQFLTDANFAGSKFYGDIDFRSARFNGLASFMRSRFFGDVSFGYSQFVRAATFSSAEFDGNVSFANAQFGDDVGFDGASFFNDATFDFVQVSRRLTFFSARFLGETSIANAVFVGAANFIGTSFEGNVSFTGTKFDSDAFFRSAEFRRTAVFGGVSFGGFSDFTSAKFESLAIFALAKFSDNAYFVGAAFDSDLILQSARIYSMQLDNATFGADSSITLQDADFSRLIIRWDKIRDHLVFDGAAYQALVKNYKSLEWFDDADDCYFTYRMIEQDQEPWGWTKVADIIAWISCGYGVRVSYVSLCCLLTVMAFGLIYWAGNGMRRFELSGREVPGDEKGTNDFKTPLTDAMYFSVAMFTTSQAPYYNYPVGFYRHLAMLEGILGWFFLGLFVVVLSGVLIR